MITFGRSYIVDGRAYATIQQAQAAALNGVFSKYSATESPNARELVTDAILDNRDAVIDILTTKDTSLPRARRVNGGTKKRKKLVDSQEPTKEVA